MSEATAIEMVEELRHLMLEQAAILGTLERHLAPRHSGPKDR